MYMISFSGIIFPTKTVIHIQKDILFWNKSGRARINDKCRSIAIRFFYYQS